MWFMVAKKGPRLAPLLVLASAAVAQVIARDVFFFEANNNARVYTRGVPFEVDGTDLCLRGCLLIYFRLDLIHTKRSVPLCASLFV